METASFVLQNEGTHVQAQLCSRIGKYSARLGRLFDSGSAQSLGSFSTYIDCLMGTSARSRLYHQDPMLVSSSWCAEGLLLSCAVMLPPCT